MSHLISTPPKFVVLHGIEPKFTLGKRVVLNHYTTGPFVGCDGVEPPESEDTWFTAKPATPTV